MSPGQTVRPQLLGMTVGDLLAEAQERLRHLDLLDAGQRVDSFSLLDHGDWIYKSVY